MRRLFKWGSSSLGGHLVLFEIFVSMPLFLIFVGLTSSEGTLTMNWGLRLAVIWFAIGATLAVLCWHVISLPIINKKNGRPRG